MHSLCSCPGLPESSLDLIAASEHTACERLQSRRIDDHISCHHGVELVVLLLIGGVGDFVRGLGDVAERTGWDEGREGDEKKVRTAKYMNGFEWTSLFWGMFAVNWIGRCGCGMLSSEQILGGWIDLFVHSSVM